MKVREAMTADVKLASPDQTLREVAQAMIQGDIGALPVGQGDRLGIVALGDIASREGGRKIGKALAGISTPGGEHSQSTAAH